MAKRKRAKGQQQQNDLQNITF